VQCSIDPVWIITAYDPTLNSDKWDKDFKRRQVRKILHVQCSIDPVWIITAYDPTLNSDKWDKDFKRRQVKS
jgi:hypothetical protein